MTVCLMCEAPLPSRAVVCDACGTPVPKAAKTTRKKSTPAKKTAATAPKKATPKKKAAKAASPLAAARARAGVVASDVMDGLEAQNASRGPLVDTTFFVKGQPIQQGSMKAVGMAGRGLLVDIKAAELKKWRPAVAKAGLDAGVGYAPKENPIYIDVVFCLLKPVTAKRDTPCALIDLDKLCRAIGDGLSDVLYKDDRQNVNWNAVKVYVTDPADQGALLRIGPWTPAAADRGPLLTTADHEHVIATGTLPTRLKAT